MKLVVYQRSVNLDILFFFAGTAVYSYDCRCSITFHNESEHVAQATGARFSLSRQGDLCMGLQLMDE
jgi:hypothetical protein